jgi:hypothetical protein
MKYKIGKNQTAASINPNNYVISAEQENLMDNKSWIVYTHTPIYENGHFLCREKTVNASKLSRNKAQIMFNEIYETITNRG